MLPVISHNIPIGDVLMHGSCGNTFHYLALRWSLDYNKSEGKVELAKSPIPVMVCPKCHLDNDSGAANQVAAQIWKKVLNSITPK